MQETAFSAAHLTYPKPSCTLTLVRDLSNENKKQELSYTCGSQGSSLCAGGSWAGWALVEVSGAALSDHPPPPTHISTGASLHQS